MASILITDAPIIQALEAESSPDFETLWDILKSGTVQGFITPNDLQALEQHLNHSVGEAVAHHLIAGFQSVLAVYDEAEHPTIDIIIDAASVDMGTDDMPIRSVSDFLCLYELECLLTAGAGDGMALSSLFSDLSEALPVLDGEDAFEAIASVHASTTPIDEMVPVLNAPLNDGTLTIIASSMTADPATELADATPSLTRMMQVILYGNSTLAAAQQGREYGRTGRDRTFGEPHFGSADADAAFGFTSHVSAPDVLLILGLMVDWGLTSASPDTTISVPMRLGLFAGADSTQSRRGVSDDGLLVAHNSVPQPLTNGQNPRLTGEFSDVTDTSPHFLAAALSADSPLVSPLVGPVVATSLESLSLNPNPTPQAGNGQGQAVNNGSISQVNQGTGEGAIAAEAIAPSPAASEQLGQVSLATASDRTTSPSLIAPQLAAMMAGKLWSDQETSDKENGQMVGAVPFSSFRSATTKSVTPTVSVLKALQPLIQPQGQSTVLSPYARAIVQQVLTGTLTTALPKAISAIYSPLNSVQGNAVLTQTATQTVQFATYGSTNYESLDGDAVDLSSLGFYIYLSLYSTNEAEVYLDAENAALPFPPTQPEASLVGTSNIASSDNGAYAADPQADDWVEVADANDIYTSLVIDIFTVQEAANGDQSGTFWLEMADGVEYEADEALAFFETNGLDPDDMLLQIDSVIAQELILVNGEAMLDDALGNNGPQRTRKGEELDIVIWSDIGVTMYQQTPNEVFIEGFYHVSAADLLAQGTTASLEGNGIAVERLTLDDIFDTSSGF